MSDTHKGGFLAQSFRHTILLMKLDECTVATLKMKTHVKVDGQTFRIYAQNLVPDT